MNLGPEPAFPGFDQYEGDLRFSHHSVVDRMLKDGNDEAAVRMVLASPLLIQSSRNKKHPTRFLVEGIGPAGNRLRVVLDHDAQRCEFLWVASVFALDVKPVRIRVPARSLWRVWFSLDRFKSEVSMGKPNGRGDALVSVASPIAAVQEDIVREIESIIEDE